MDWLDLVAVQWTLKSLFQHLNSKASIQSIKCWIPPRKDTPCPRAKEKPQQDGRRGEIVSRIKPHACQRCLEGSNKPCVHQDPETPRACSNSCPLSRWWTISSCVVPFSFWLESFPASGSFPMSQFFASGGHSIGVSALASVLPMNIQE